MSVSSNVRRTSPTSARSSSGLGPPTIAMSVAPFLWPWVEESGDRRDGRRPSGRHGDVDLIDGVVDGMGDEAHQEVQGGDQVVGADPDAGAVGVVFVAPEPGPVALEERVVAPDGLLCPAGEVDVAAVGVGHGLAPISGLAMGSRSMPVARMASRDGARTTWGARPGWWRTTLYRSVTVAACGWGAGTRRPSTLALTRSGSSVISAPVRARALMCSWPVRVMRAKVRAL